MTTTAPPTPFTPLDFAAAVDFFAYIFNGEHNIPGDEDGERNVKRYGDGWHVVYHGSLATWDGNRLTSLVLLAHDLCVRVEIIPASKALKIAIWGREFRAGRVDVTHPTLEQAIERHRRYYPAGSVR